MIPENGWLTPVDKPAAARNSLHGASDKTRERAERYADLLKRLARLSEISTAEAAPKGSVQVVVRGENLALPLAGIVDIAAEKTRLAKALKEADGDIARCDGKLNNANFIARAAEDVIAEQREKRLEAAERSAFAVATDASGAPTGPHLERRRPVEPRTGVSDARSTECARRSDSGERREDQPRRPRRHR